jgi:Zn finger protein HypA/HybF involved in hydrogenase expression
MHEFSIVEGYVADLVARLHQDKVLRVDEIQFRRNSTFSEDALRMAFASYSVGTPLEGAVVVIETVPVTFKCQCGHHQVISADELQGHMVVCPSCGVVQEIDEADDISMTRIVVGERSAGSTLVKG